MGHNTSETRHYKTDCIQVTSSVLTHAADPGTERTLVFSVQQPFLGWGIPELESPAGLLSGKLLQPLLFHPLIIRETHCSPGFKAAQLTASQFHSGRHFYTEERGARPSPTHLGTLAKALITNDSDNGKAHVLT